jgi:hypothetical protein
MGVVTVLASAVMLHSCFRARSTAREFLDAVHDGRLADARDLAAPELQPFLADNPPPAIRDSDRFHTLDEVRAATHASLGAYSGSIDGGCLGGELEGQGTFWIIARFTQGHYLVVDLGSQSAPDDCDFSGD